MASKTFCRAVLDKRRKCSLQSAACFLDDFITRNPNLDHSLYGNLHAISTALKESGVASSGNDARTGEAAGPRGPLLSAAQGASEPTHVRERDTQGPPHSKGHPRMQAPASTDGQRAGSHARMEGDPEADARKLEAKRKRRDERGGGLTHVPEQALRIKQEEVAVLAGPEPEGEAKRTKKKKKTVRVKQE
eukprot:jgi/Botrbrau1/22790/Bobra.0132s0116.1